MPDQPALAGPPSAPVPASVRLEFLPSTLLIPVVRQFVSEFYECLLHNPDAVSRVALATHELLENAAKYSSTGGASLAIAVDAREGVDAVTISIRNPTSEEHVGRVTGLIDAMNQYEDPFEFYQLQMRKTARLKEGSGLGLVRVCVEGEMKLRWSTESGALEIFAETEIRRTV